jgi:heat shock protein HslJ
LTALEDVTWVLESYGEQGNLQAVLTGSEITAEFKGEEGQVGGSAGCNHYFGGYEAKGDGLSVSMLASTEMYCDDPEGVMDQELQYLKTLQTAESYKVQDGELHISCADNQVLIFHAR